MLIDHAGLMLFPDIMIMRYIGRLALPIFAFMVAEGVLHTRNKLKYFLRVFILGVACQVVYTVYDLVTGNFHGVYLNTLITLSIGILICYAWEKAVENRKKIYLLIIAILALAAFHIFSTLPVRSADGMYIVTLATKLCGFYVEMDYSFMGAILPLTALIVTQKPYRFVMYGMGLALLSLQCMSGMPYQWICLLAIPILWLYNGERGTVNLKYLFYIFYPLHLGILEGISLLIKK